MGYNELDDQNSDAFCFIFVFVSELVLNCLFFSGLVFYLCHLQQWDVREFEGEETVYGHKCFTIKTILKYAFCLTDSHLQS